MLRVALELILDMMMTRTAILILAVATCVSTSLAQGDSQPPVSHEIWNTLVARHVKADGMVNYKGFKADESQLDSYLDQLSANPPDAAGMEP